MSVSLRSKGVLYCLEYFLYDLLMRAVMKGLFNLLHELLICHEVSIQLVSFDSISYSYNYNAFIFFRVRYGSYCEVNKYVFLLF